MTRRQLLLASLAMPAQVEVFRLQSGSEADIPILPGSLVKPFTALAYGEKFPTAVRCTGCWGNRAHGEVDFVKALAVSCNRYFEELSLRVDPQRMRLTTAEYGLPAPPDNVEARIGLGREWRISPRALLKAYMQLRHPAILEGLRTCAKTGTAKAVGRGLAKTGTAACEHIKRMPGDGLAIVLWPANEPREAILVREHGVPGSVAARRLNGLLKT
jgi:cell division protein FtsI/penicillin-binding protein 2